MDQHPLPSPFYDRDLQKWYTYYDYRLQQYCNSDGQRWIYQSQDWQARQQSVYQQPDVRHHRVDSGRELDELLKDLNIGESSTSVRTPAAVSDPRCRVRRENEGIFVRGRVLRCCWMEEASADASYDEDAKTYISTNTLGHEVYSKYRIFVVIKDNENHSSTCLPITTYGGRGVAKDGVRKRHHSIIYSGREEPKPKSKELPKAGEHGMRRSIRVRLNQGNKLDEMSRINLNVAYPISHKAKVHDMGMVHKDYLAILEAEWRAVNRF